MTSEERTAASAEAESQRDPVRCPTCGKSAEGKFCPHCGAGLETAPCSACGETPSLGARFCNHCGAPIAEKMKGVAVDAAPPIGWWVAAAFAVAFLFVALIPILRPEETPPAAPTPAGTASGLPDLTTMTEREAADRLFDRVMRAVEADDAGEIQIFLPMSIDAYRRVPGLDPDGYFHLAILQQTAGDTIGARQASEAALAINPDHLLGLAAAGGAAEALGDTEAARRYYQRFLDIYDEQLATNNVDYELHAQLLPGMKEAAESYLAGAGG